MFITFGKCNLKKFIFLSVPLIKLIRELAFFSKAFYGVDNILMQHLFLCVAKFANVIFWFILIKKIKFPKKINIDKNDKIHDSEKQKKLIYKNSQIGLSQKELNIYEKENKKRKKICKKILILILSSFLDFISNIVYLFSYASISGYNFEKTSAQENNQNMINLIPFRINCRIISIYVLSLIILYSNRPYRHQILSLFLIIIFLILANIIEIFLNIIKKENYMLIHFIIFFVQEFLFSLDYVVGAKYLSISNGNLYKLLFAKGLFGIIGITIIHFLTGFIHCSDLYLKEKYCVKDNLKYFYILNIDGIKTSQLITSLILTIVELACTWLLIFYQTANHLSIAGAIHLTYRFLIGRNDFNINHFIISIICLILIIFFSLIYNEIIILKICGLEKNTFEEIEKRAAEEQIIEERISLENSLEGINSTDD